MKKILSLVLALSMLLSLCAVAAAEEEKITLRFSWWGGDARHEATLKVIEQFEALYPNVTIEAEYGGNDGYHDKLATNLSSGTAADIVQIDPEVFPTYVANGDYFYNLDDFDIDMSVFDEAYIHQRINGYYDGKQLGLPTGIAGPAFLINKDVADSVNVDLSGEITWESLLELGKAAHEANPEVYLLCANKEYLVNLIVFNYVKQQAGSTVFVDGKLVATEEHFTKAYEYVKALFDNNVVAPIEYMAAYQGDAVQSDANWLAGKYVGTMTYISTVDVMVAGNPNATYYPAQLPVMDGATEGGWASNTPQVLTITKSCKHPEMAAAFLNYFYANETAMETLGAVRSVPPQAKAREICAANGSLTKIVSDAANIAAAIGGTPNDKVSSTNESKNILFDAVELVAYGEMTPAEAAADTIEQLKELEK